MGSAVLSTLQSLDKANMMKTKSPAIAIALTLVVLAIAWLARAPSAARDVPALQRSSETAAAEGAVVAGELEGGLPTSRSEARSAASDAATADPSTGQVVAPVVTLIRGHLVDELGRPLAKAHVGLEDSSSIEPVSSDAAGAFALSIQPWPETRGESWTCVVEAALAGCESKKERVTVFEGETVELGVWVLLPACVVEGQIVDRGGAPLEGLEVACLRSPPALGAPALADLTTLAGLATSGGIARSDRDGRFRLELGASESVVLAAAGPGWRPVLSEPFACGAGVVVDGVELVLEESAGNREVSGIVLSPAGDPVPDARVRYQAGRGSGMRITDEAGRFRLTSLPASLSELTATDPEGRWGEARLQEVERGSVGVELRLRKSRRFDVLVLDLAGTPVEEFALVVTREGPPASVIANLPLERREAGRAPVLLPDGPFSLWVEAPGFMPLAIGAIQPGELDETHEIRLSPARGIRGRVLNDGRPVPGAVVSLHREFSRLALVKGIPARSSPIADATMQSGEGGEYLLGVAVAGNYFLRVEASGLAPWESGPLELGPNATLLLDAGMSPGGALECVLRSVASTDVAGHVLLLDRGDGFARTARTNGEGVHLAELLAPGPWRVTAVDEELPPGLVLTRSLEALPTFEANCRVVEGTVTRIEVWLDGDPRTTRLFSGELRVDGGGADGWTAHLQGAAGEELDTEVLDSEGRFAFELSPTGSYRLLITGAASRTVVMTAIDEGRAPAIWKLAFETAALRGPVPTIPLPHGRALFHHWRRADMECFTPLLPIAEGELGSTALPAGTARLVSIDPNSPLDSQELESLLELTLEAGRINTLKW